MKRRKDFWFANEKKVLNELGFQPSPQSGGGWIYKEDGENEYYISQLKSTDKHSYKINLLDLQKLMYHARISNKIPMFIIQFIGNTTWCMLKVEDFKLLTENTDYGNIKIESVIQEEVNIVHKETIKGGDYVREEAEIKSEELNFDKLFAKRKLRKQKEEYKNQLKQKYNKREGK